MISTSNHRHTNRHPVVWYLARPILFNQYPPIRIPRSSRLDLGPRPPNQTPSITPHHLDSPKMGFSTYPHSILHGNVHLSPPPRILPQRNLPHDLFSRHYRILPLLRSRSRTSYLGRSIGSLAFRG
jgi:hypothetical protein